MDEALFLDASALVKAYVQEEGTEAVKAVCHRPAQALFISDLVTVEVLANFAARFRKDELSDESYESYRESLRRHRGERYTVLRLTPEILERALELMHLHRERGFGGADAVHLATAEHLRGAQPGRSVVFVCADRKLARVALRCGFRVFDPETDGPERLGPPLR